MSTIDKILIFSDGENDLVPPAYIAESVLSSFEVNGTGNLVITNTGGSSASEGGMGSGSDDDTEKGSLSKPGEKSGQASRNDDEEDLTLDPLKKNIKEAERKNDKD
jgi:hypothetical protein